MHYYDGYADARRNDEARELLSDFDAVVAQEVPIPVPVGMAALNEEQGAKLKYVLGRDAEFRHLLLRVNEAAPHAGTLMAISEVERHH